MSTFDSPDLAALNRAMAALTAVQVSIDLVGKYLANIERDSNQWHLHFNDLGELKGFSHSADSDMVLLNVEEYCPVSSSDCEWLIKHIDSLWEHYREADQAIGLLPPRLVDRLDGLTGKPWVATVRRKCLDNILKWPGETAHQTSYAAKKVRGNVSELLENAKQFPPYDTWADFEKQLQEFGHDLFSIRDAVLPSTAVSKETPRDVHLDDATIAKARAMAAYLNVLSSANTTVSSMFVDASPSSVIYVADASKLAEAHPDSANTAKLFPGGLPRNQDVIDLVVRLDAERIGGRSQRKIAMEFVSGNRRKALSLLSQIRRLKREGKISL